MPSLWAENSNMATVTSPTHAPKQLPNTTASLALAPTFTFAHLPIGIQEQILRYLCNSNYQRQLVVRLSHTSIDLNTPGTRVLWESAALLLGYRASPKRMRKRGMKDFETFMEWVDETTAKNTEVVLKVGSIRPGFALKWLRKVTISGYAPLESITTLVQTCPNLRKMTLESFNRRTTRGDWIRLRRALDDSRLRSFKLVNARGVQVDGLSDRWCHTYDGLIEVAGAMEELHFRDSLMSEEQISTILLCAGNLKTFKMTKTLPTKGFEDAQIDNTQVIALPWLSLTWTSLPHLTTLIIKGQSLRGWLNFRRTPIICNVDKLSVCPTLRHLALETVEVWTTKTKLLGRNETHIVPLGQFLSTCFPNLESLSLFDYDHTQTESAFTVLANKKGPFRRLKKLTLELMVTTFEQYIDVLSALQDLVSFELTCHTLTGERPTDLLKRFQLKLVDSLGEGIECLRLGGTEFTTLSYHEQDQIVMAAVKKLQRLQVLKVGKGYRGKDMGVGRIRTLRKADTWGEGTQGGNRDGESYQQESEEGGWEDNFVGVSEWFDEGESYHHQESEEDSEEGGWEDNFMDVLGWFDE
ncbi:hypothetical protein HK102_000208 [Quaeritorhiza haematococci]|nr:hypothetical protein HK102_000208 [Quaeritorhiza haematococci]